ncbi:MAG: cation:proton antiporter [Candidatus Rokubacteria bacterium]|nr:cation:proton antiporter [Candidatus Rokubacteria bacterium]
MIERHDSTIVTTFVRLLVPLAQLFALYVLVHGHESPGGGFQAGVILAASYIVLALGLGREALDRRVNERLCLALASGGVLIYVLTGIVGMMLGRALLDYAALPLPVTPARARFFGILFVETGITLAVAGTLIVLFCRLGDTERE